MTVQKSIKVLTVMELYTELLKAVNEGKGDSYVLLPAYLDDGYDDDYVYACGVEANTASKCIYINALSSEDDIVAQSIIKLQ